MPRLFASGENKKVCMQTVGVSPWNTLMYDLRDSVSYATFVKYQNTIALMGCSSGYIWNYQINKCQSGKVIYELAWKCICKDKIIK